MRSRLQPHGKFYTVPSQTEINQQHATTDACLPKGARGHMVMVLGWADQWNWVKVVTITSSAASTLQYVDYLPIYPSKKNQHSGVQLKLCNDWDAWTLTEKRSYVRMDGVYEIPVERLLPAGANGRQYELQSKSWDKVQDFLRNRTVLAIHNGPIAPDSIYSPIHEGEPSQVVGAGVTTVAGEYSSHMPV